MSERVRINLQPLGERFEVERGTPLRDVLFEHGVEFPCGGEGRCRGCRVKLVAGTLPVLPADEEILEPQEIAAGWRLACQGRAETDLTLEIAQWEQNILADESAFAFTPHDGLGVAVDLGTTTLVAQLVDRRTGHVLAVESALNPQAVHGGDIMSRVQFAVQGSGRAKLERLIRDRIGAMIAGLLQSAQSEAADVRRVAIVGNTVMHHLFCGLDLTPLSVYPFETEVDGRQVFTATGLGWDPAIEGPIEFLPCLGSFVGSDILAGVLATRVHERDALVGLMDLGTNGEILIGSRERMLCASTAAGPAFEGARITMGMRAATGAIFEVRADAGRLGCRTLGQGPPRGICGSGLVDAVAASLDLGLIEPGGRLAGGASELPLMAPVRLTQGDIRELQLAKAAIAAGARILLEQWGAAPEDLSALYVAGAFGNYINRDSARRIGLIEWPPEKVRPAGNTALLGAKIALFTDSAEVNDFAAIRSRVEHVPLAADERFMDTYVECMRFPVSSEGKSEN